MKGYDILVLIELLRSGSDSSMTFQRIGQKLGASGSQIFDSFERCAEIGLLGKDRRVVNHPRLLALFQHALPYLFPSRIGGPGRGIPLSVQHVEGRFPNRGMDRSARLIWPSTSPGAVEGLSIEPLDKRIPVIVQAEPRLIHLLSCLEILRLPDHSLRSWACDRLGVELRELMPRSRAGEDLPSPAEGGLKPESIDLDSVVDVSNQYISQHGFRSTRLADIARVTGIPEAILKGHFESEAALFEAVNVKNMKTVGEFLGRLGILSHRVGTKDLRELMQVFLEFLERNENWFRLMLWSYLEPDLDEPKMIPDAFSRVIEDMGRLIALATGKGDAASNLFRGYAFISIPQWYALFLWVESGKFKDKEGAARIQGRFKDFISRDVLDRILNAD